MSRARIGEENIKRKVNVWENKQQFNPKSLKYKNNFERNNQPNYRNQCIKQYNKPQTIFYCVHTIPKIGSKLKQYIVVGCNPRKRIHTKRWWRMIHRKMYLTTWFRVLCTPTCRFLIRSTLFYFASFFIFVRRVLRRAELMLHQHTELHTKTMLWKCKSVFTLHLQWKSE